MNYTEWIKTIGLVINLIVKTEVGSSISVEFEWKQSLPTDLFIKDSISVLYISFNSKNESGKIAGLYLIPWDNLYSPYPGDDWSAVPRYNLFTVTEYSIIYEELTGGTINEATKENLDKLMMRLRNLFDYEENQKIVSEKDGLTTTQGIQIISETEYKFYVVQKVALPGSKQLLKSDYKSMPENKMILRHLVPDMGSVKSQWLVPPIRNRDVCLESADNFVLKTINETIEQLINSDTVDLTEAFNKTWNSIDSFLINLQCDDIKVKNYFKSFLQKVFDCNGQIIWDISANNIFGDYQPKLTPDELYDYMPSVYDEFLKLPVAELINLPTLLTCFKKYHKLASKNRGRWVDGNVILGANPKEYKPSFQELMLCEIGNRINTIKDNNSSREIREIVKQKTRWPGKIKFTKFSVIHFDVMGSGRFFYINSIEHVKFSLY